ncbi:unnamed protein product [Lathyrus sativus]|nr:unnamed protein product [Lathyrus sativus]
MPKKFNYYKWILGLLFSTNEEFKEAIASYVVHNGRDLRYLKNDKTRVRVGCKEWCGWVALCSKLPNANTWNLRTLNDNHTCNKEFNVRMFNSNWPGKKLYTKVRINPNVKLTAMCEKVHEKWNVGMNRMKAYRAQKTTLSIVEGSFNKKYHRFYDYAHELLRPIIGVDGCFLKGNYGGQILAVVERDPNYQMLPIALVVVEAETKDTWACFFDILVRDLGGPEVYKYITFISDQQKRLSPAIDELLPRVDKRFYVRHLYRNFTKRFPGKHLKELIWREAKETYPQAWERERKEMRKINNVIIGPRQNPIVKMLEETYGN